MWAWPLFLARGEGDGESTRGIGVSEQYPRDRIPTADSRIPRYKVILGEKESPWPELLDKNVTLRVQAHRATIKVLTRQIEIIEATLLKHLKPIPEYKSLLTVPGIGPVIAWTIVLEADELERFADVGHFASYCRCVDSKRISNERKKGENNTKNGNPYLAWAFFEAAHFAIQYLPSAKRFYERSDEIASSSTSGSKVFVIARA
jgi:transposase